MKPALKTKFTRIAIIPVSASSLKEAFQLVNTLEYDLPEGEYVEDTYEIDYDRLEE